MSTPNRRPAPVSTHPNQVKLLVATDHTFIEDQGHVYDDYCFQRSFFDDYLAEFAQVNVVCRARERIASDTNLGRSDGDGLHFRSVGNLHGPRWIIEASRISLPTIAEVGTFAGCIVARVPSQLGYTAAAYARAQGMPYMCEVIGDPLTAWPSTKNTLPYRVLGLVECWRMRRALLGASVASYVTRIELPTRYPAPAAVATDFISSIRLPNAWLRPGRTSSPSFAPLKLVHIGSLIPRKRPLDILETAMALTNRHGVPTVAVFAGDGPERSKLVNRANEAGLPNCLELLGQVSSRDGILQLLDRSDLYICASGSEGLPRGALEGMSRGLPLVGTQLPGLQELLPREELVAIGDVEGFTRRVLSITSSPEAYFAASTRSCELAKEYSLSVLSKRRRHLYRLLSAQVRQP